MILLDGVKIIKCWIKLLACWYCVSGMYRLVMSHYKKQENGNCLKSVRKIWFQCTIPPIYRDLSAVFEKKNSDLVFFDAQNTFEKFHWLF